MPTKSRGPAGRAHPSGPRLSSRPRSGGSGGSTPSPLAGDAANGDPAAGQSGSVQGRQPTSRGGAESSRGQQSSADHSDVAESAGSSAGGGAGTSVTTRTAVLLGVLAILAASYALPVRAWLDQRDQLAAVSEQRDALEAEVAELRDAVALWQDPAFVRAQARERLNYVRPGEVGLIVLGTEETTPPESVAGVVVPAPESDQPWWSTLVSAFTEVGNADSAADDGTGASPADDADGAGGDTATDQPGDPPADAPAGDS